MTKTQQPPPPMQNSGLDDFNPERRRALIEEWAARERGQFPLPRPLVNLHTHTFYSYNACGYSPSHFAWRARTAALEVAGIVDFDVLDGVEEFLEAGRLLGLKSCASIETRVFVPEFADRVINSPGEPGVAYHMGAGFVSGAPPAEARPFLENLRRRSAERNREIIRRVNVFTQPVALDYENDVLPLTPNGNATERHICLAYALKAAQQMKNTRALAEYWYGLLGASESTFDLPAGPKLQGAIRARLMKRGGVGYIQPDPHSFPLLEAMNRFTLECGAIPTLAWLDGTSEGERDMATWLDTAAASGTAAINIIPDRNYTPGRKDRTLRNLYDVVALAEQRGLPVLVGTEMNSPGQKIVDDFECDELRPLVPVFLKGAHILYAHTVLQQHAGLGYLSGWACRMFSTIEDKNEFFRAFGERFQPGMETRLAGLNETNKSMEFLTALS